MNLNFVPTPQNPAQAAFQARVMDRAKTLLTDGYVIVYGRNVSPNNPAMQYIAAVTSPEMKTYGIDFLNNTCECDCCVKNQFCKHLLAVLIEEDKAEAAADEAQVAAYEADLAACENERTGVDYLRF